MGGGVVEKKKNRGFLTDKGTTPKVPLEIGNLPEGANERQSLSVKGGRGEKGESEISAAESGKA